MSETDLKKLREHKLKKQKLKIELLKIQKEIEVKTRIQAFKDTIISLQKEIKEAAELKETMSEAELGDAEAQNNLGLAYEKGQGIKQDYKEAVSWFTKSADQGNTFAREQLQIIRRQYGSKF